MGRIMVALPGPPWVRTYTTLRSDSVNTVSNRKPMMRMGKIIGVTTWRNRWRNEQPSTRAASSTSVGTEVNPARRTMAEKGKDLQTLTPMQARSANCGWPSQMGQLCDPEPPMSPALCRPQLITLNCESYIHFQDSTLTVMGSVNGMT